MCHLQCFFWKIHLSAIHTLFIDMKVPYWILKGWILGYWTLDTFHSYMIHLAAIHTAFQTWKFLTGYLGNGYLVTGQWTLSTFHFWMIHLAAIHTAFQTWKFHMESLIPGAPRIPVSSPPSYNNYNYSWLV